MRRRAARLRRRRSAEAVVGGRWPVAGEVRGAWGWALLTCWAGAVRRCGARSGVALVLCDRFTVRLVGGLTGDFYGFALV